MARKLQTRLIEILNALPDEYASQLLDFAEFIHQRHGEDRTKLAKQDIDRPETESVIQAIKRLTQTYPMLEPSSLLTETSGFLSQNLVGGKSTKEVIDKLESLFQDRYDILKSDSKAEV